MPLTPEQSDAATAVLWFVGLGVVVATVRYGSPMYALGLVVLAGLILGGVALWRGRD